MYYTPVPDLRIRVDLYTCINNRIFADRHVIAYEALREDFYIISNPCVVADVSESSDVGLLSESGRWSNK